MVIEKNNCLGFSECILRKLHNCALENGRKSIMQNMYTAQFILS